MLQNKLIEASTLDISPPINSNRFDTFSLASSKSTLIRAGPTNLKIFESSLIKSNS